MTTEAAAPAAKENPVLSGFDAVAGEKPVEAGVDKGAPAEAKPAAEAVTEKVAPDAGEAAKEAEAKAAEAPKEEAKPEVAQNAALDEARSQLNELRQKITDLESRPTLSKDQQSALDKLKETEQATKEAEPDFLADPKGYVDAKVKAALDKLEGSEKLNKEESEKIKAQQALSNLFAATARAEATFTETTPDYQQALTYIRDMRTQQLKILYPDATGQQISQQLAHEEIAIAHQALSRNQNPAEVAYNMAKTYAYKPPEKEKPAEVEQPKPKEAKKADKEAARSMGSGGGDLPANEEEGSNTPELAMALAERFKKRA